MCPEGERVLKQKFLVFLFLFGRVVVHVLAGDIVDFCFDLLGLKALPSWLLLGQFGEGIRSFRDFAELGLDFFGLFRLFDFLEGRLHPDLSGSFTWGKLGSIILGSDGRGRLNGLHSVFILRRPALINGMFVLVAIALDHFDVESGEGMLLFFILPSGLSLIMRIG